MEKYIVKLTKDERKNLLSLINKGKAAAKKLTHARILLEADEGNLERKPQTDEAIAQLLHVSYKTVKRVRKQLVEDGLESALQRKPHSGKKPHKINGDEEARLIALCCSNPPEGRCRWTLKLLANKLVELEIIESISPSTVGRVLKKTN
jgi:transposase